MKQEANKKSKKWLWLIIAIVAVLAVVGVVLGIVLSGPSEEGPSGDADNGPKGGRADIYWNIDKAMYSNATTGMSVREPGADGKYHVTFAHDGEQVEYAFTDKRLVNYIDTADAVGLVFDDKGNVVDAVDVTTIAKELAKSFYVTKVEGDVITLNGSAVLDGLTKQITCTELTKIMNLSGPRETKGELIQPEDVKPLDMVFVYGNDLEEATHFAIMDSPAESAIYWRNACYLEPDENGLYTVEMFCNGELVSLKSKDLELVTGIANVRADMAHFGLLFDEDGYVIETQSSHRGIRGRLGCSQYDVTEVNGANFTATRLMGAGFDLGKVYTNTLPEGVPVYDVSADYLLERRGKDVGSLQLGDRINVWEDTLGNIVEIYIYNRIQNVPVYFKMDAVVNRQPDENGWFTFEMFDGKSFRMLKTKSEPLCRFLEGQKFMGLQVKGDVIEDAWNITRVLGHDYTDFARYNYTVTSVAGMIVALQNPTATAMVSKVVSPECKIYNMSGIHQKVGAETTLQTGDKGWFLFDHTGQMVYAYIAQRKVEAGIYYNLNRRYNAVEKATARTPDENGYYVFEMAHDGKLVTIKTKSKAVATKIDENVNGILGLNPNSKGVVTDAYPGAAATGGGVTGGGWWSFEGYTEDGQIELYNATNPESKLYLTPSDDMKTYNIATVGYKKFRGEAATLRKGDIVLALTDINNKTVITYITSRSFDEVKKTCEHCNKKVTFTPWTGTNFSLLKDGHYYVPGNAQGCPYSILGDVEGEKYKEYILDLNGQSVTFADGQPGFLVFNTAKLSIIDSVGGGKMVSGGNPGAGMFVVGMEGTMNVYGGTYEMPAGKNGMIAGNVVYIDGTKDPTFNFYGGKLVGKDPKVEALNIVNGIANLSSGTTIDGTVAAKLNGTLNMKGTIKITKLQIQKGKLVDFTKLGSKSKIGVVARGVFTTEMNDPGALLSILSCPVKGGSIVVEGKQLACYGTEPDYSQVYEQSLKMDFSNTEKLPKTCPYCDRNVVWSPLPEADENGDRILGGGVHYYLDKNRTVKGVYMLDGGDVCLHLNGKTITSTGKEIFTIFSGKTLAVMGKGTMKGSGNSTGGSIASVISNNGALSLCGGTYEATSKGDMPIIANRGFATNEVNIYDGTIKTSGTAIKVRGGSLGLNGGTTNGTVTTDAGGTVKLTGGTVETVKLVKDSNLEISGNPKVSKLTLAQGVLAQVAQLKSGAMIGIDAEGIFTTEFASEEAATAALAYFDVAEEGASLRREGKALYCEPAPFNFKAVIQQANAMKFPTDSSTYTAECPYCEESVQWIALSTIVDRYSETNKRYEQFLYEGRHYYADKNFTLTHGPLQNVSTTGAPCVHLNGKTITATNGHSAFITQMNIMGNGTVTMQKTAGVALPDLLVNPNGRIMNIFGGTYTTADDVFLTGTSGIFAFYRGMSGKGTLNFYGGEIHAINSDAVKIWNGGAFNMYGGKITGRPVNLYNAGTTEGGNVNIYGGEVEYIVANDGNLDVQGGKIGKITVAAAAADDLKISGAPTIAELKFLAALKAEIGELTTGASIGVNATGVFTADFTDAAAAKAAKDFFSPVQSGADIKVDGNALSCVGGGAIAPDEPAPAPEPEFNKEEAQQIINAANAMTFPTDGSDHTAKCPKCGETVTWTALTEGTDAGTINLNPGHYYLANDIIFDKATAESYGLNIFFSSGTQKVCLHLNNHNITAKGDGEGGKTYTAIRVWLGSLNLFGEGTVTCKSANWGPLVLRNGSSANIYGGTFVNSYNGNNSASAISISCTGNTNIYNAKITAGKLYVSPTAGNVVVYNGTYPVVNINSQSGGNYLLDGTYGTVNLDGALNVKGGTISKLVLTENTNMLRISGKTVINELDMTACNIKLTLNQLESGAEIKVKAKEGVFTKEFADEADATAAKAFFTGVSGEVKVEGKALAFTPSATPDPDPTPDPTPDPEPAEKTPAQIIAEANAMTFPTDGSNHTAQCPKCGDVKTWKPLTADTAGMVGGASSAGNHFYLAGDVTRTANLMGYYGSVCVHLNGHKLSGTSSPIFNGALGNELAIMGQGTVSGTSNIFTCNSTAAANNSARLSIYGGKFETTGGGYIISANTVAGRATTVNIYAGEFGTAGNASVIAAGATKLNISGAPVIGTLNLTDVTVDVTGLTEGAQIGLGTTPTGVFTTAFGSKELAEAALKYFKLNSATGMTVTVNDDAQLVCNAISLNTVAEKVTFANNMKIEGTGDQRAYCAHCGKVQTWKQLTADTAGMVGGASSAGNHFYLAGDVTRTANLMGYYGSVCVHLNGHKLSGTSSPIFNGALGNELAIMGRGTVSGTGNIFACNSNPAANNSAKLSIYGGKFETTGGDYIVSANTVADRATTVNIYGGEFGTAGTASVIVAGATKLNISGAPVITTLDMTAATVKATVGEMKTGASIGVKAEGLFTGDIQNVSLVKEFFSAVVSGKEIAIVGQALSCVNA